MTAAHPLKGKLLRWSDEGYERHCLRRFLVPLGDGFWLMQCMSPHDGTDLAEKYIMSLSQIAEGEERGEVFDSWAALQEADAHTAIIHNLHELNGKAEAERDRQRRRAINLVPDDGGPLGAA